MALPRTCEFNGCENFLGPGGANIGYKIKQRIKEVKACAECTSKVLYSPRGTWEITEDQRLVPIPARPLYFT